MWLNGVVWCCARFCEWLCVVVVCGCVRVWLCMWLCVIVCVVMCLVVSGSV